MATFDELIKSDQFRQAAPEDKLKIVNAHWDSVASMTPEEDRDNVEMYRKLSVGGMEAIGRARGELGTGSFKEQYANEAQAYNNAWGILHSKNPDEEVFSNSLKAVQNAVRDTGIARKTALDDINARITRGAQLSDTLRQSITGGDPNAESEFLTGVVNSPDGSGLKRNSQGQWEMPTGTVSIAEPDMSPSSAGVIDRTLDFVKAVPTALGHTIAGIATGAANALGATTNQHSASIEAWQKANNLTDEEVQSAYADIGNRNRQWQGSEMFRVMSSGRIEPNPGSAGLLDKKATTEAVLAATAPDIAKEEFLGQIDSYRDKATEELMKSFGTFSQQHGRAVENFSEFYTNAKTKNPQLTNADIVSSYVKQEKFGTLGKLWSEFTTEGMNKLGQTVAGVGGALGVETMGDWAANTSRDNQKMSAAAGALFGDTGILDSVIKEAPSVAATILLTRGAGLTTFGAARALTPLAEGATAVEIAAAQATRLSAAQAAGMVVGVGSSALQSAGVTYSDNLMQNLDAGMNRDKAHEKAQEKALIAGITTGFITGAFSALGHGGIETAGLQGMTVGELAEEAATHGIPFATAARNGITKLVEGISAKSKIAGFAAKGVSLPVNLALRGMGNTVVKGVLAEGAEEGIDQLLGKFLQADPGTPIFNAFTEAWEAAKVGGIFGGFSGAVELKAERAKARDETARSAAMAAVEAGKSRSSVLSESELADAAARESGAFVDQRKPGEVTEVWRGADGKLTGMRYDPNGVSFVRQASDGTWIDEAGPRTNIDAARRRMVNEGLIPMSGKNADGTEVHFTPEQATAEIERIKSDTGERSAAFAQSRQQQIDDRFARAKEQEQRSREAIAKSRNDAVVAANLKQAQEETEAEAISGAIGRMNEEQATQSELVKERVRKEQNLNKVEQKTGEALEEEFTKSLKETARQYADNDRAAALLAEQRAQEGVVPARPDVANQEGVTPVGSGESKIDPEIYTDAEGDSEETKAKTAKAKVAAEWLTQNGVTTFRQAFGHALDQDLYKAADTGAAFPVALLQNLKAVLDSSKTQGWVGTATNPEATPDVGTPPVQQTPTPKPNASENQEAGRIPTIEGVTPNQGAEGETETGAPQQEGPNQEVAPTPNEPAATPTEEAVPEAAATTGAIENQGPTPVGTGTEAAAAIPAAVAPEVAAILGTVPAFTIVGDSEATTTNSGEEALQIEFTQSAGVDIEVMNEPSTPNGPSITDNQAGKLASDLATANPEEVADVKTEATEKAGEAPPVDINNTDLLDERGASHAPASKYGYGSQSPISLSAKTLNKVVSSLSKRFNLVTKWVTNLPDGTFGQYDPETGEIHLNKNMVGKTSETMLHEVAHPFLAAIKTGNPSLYAKLVAEMNGLIDGDPALQRIRNRIIDAYPQLNEEEIMDELMATYIGHHGDGLAGRLIDTSSEGAKNWAGKVWKAITNLFKTMFKGRMNVSDLGPNTSIGDIVNIITDPAAFFDIGGVIGPADVTSRHAIQEYAFGMKHAANAALASINGSGIGLSSRFGKNGAIVHSMIFGSDGKADIQKMSDISERLNNGIPRAQWDALSEKLKSWTDYKLGGGFWKGHENILAKINAETNNSPLNANNVGYLIDNIVRHPSVWSSAVNSGDVDLNQITIANNVQNYFWNMDTGKVRTDVMDVADSHNNSLMVALGEHHGILTDASERAGIYAQLTPEQVQIFRGALQHRSNMANLFIAAAANPVVSDEAALQLHQLMATDEHAAAKLASEMVKWKQEETVPIADVVENRTPGEQKGKVAKALAAAASAAIQQVSDMVTSNMPRIPTAQAVIKATNDIFDHAQKTAIAKMLGFTSWTSRTEDALASRFADWIVSAETAVGKLGAVMERIGIYLRGIVAGAVVAISVTSSTAPVSQFIPFAKVATESGVTTSVDGMSLDAIARAAGRANEARAAEAEQARQARNAEALGTASNLINQMGQAAVAQAPAAGLESPAAQVATAPDLGGPELAPGVAEAAPPQAGQIKEPQITTPSAPVATPIVAPVAAPIPKANFNRTNATDGVTVMANWIVGNNDNKGAPFILADKNEGTVYMFDSDGNLTRKSAALFGRTAGDIAPSDIGTRSIDFIRANPKYKVTPSGRFDSATEPSTPEYGDVVPVVDNNLSKVLIHKVFLGRPEENREGRLDTKSGADNRISLGCINLHNSDSNLANDLFRDGGVVYVLPETDEGVNTFSGFQALKETRSRRPRRMARSGGRATKPLTTPVRIGDGTRDGLYNAIPADPAYESPSGAGRIMPITDGSPQVGFKKVGEALSFRAKMAAREGLIATELKIITDSKDGEVSYFVVVPDSLGQAEALRAGQAFSVAIADPTASIAMPTIRDNKSYIANSGNNLIKLFRHITKSAQNVAFEHGWLVANNVDQEAAGENLSEAVKNNLLQVAWAKSMAGAKMKALRAKHGNPMGTDRTFGSDTYGHALDVKVKPGQSPWTGDILQRSMVDPTAYDLTPKQTEFVNDVRKILEGMRQQMRDAKLDKAYLKTGGNDVQKFLDDPTLGDNSWREYFPREVIGYLDENGIPQTKPYIGAASPNTTHKGFDESRMVDKDGKWLSHQQIANGTPEQQSVIYAADEFDIMEGFISKSYSAIAASDLAANLDQFIVNRGPDAKSTLRNAFVAGIPVLNDSIFTNEVAKFLNTHLVDNKKISEGLQGVLQATSFWKSLVLGLDLAGGLTVAGVGTMTAAYRTGGVFAAIENIGGQVMDVARAANTDPKVYQKLCAELSPYMLEMATLNGKIGSGQDWQQVQAEMVKNYEITKTLAGKQSAVGAAMNALGQFGKRLNDYHTNVCEIGKVQMWRSVRERFLDANGNLRTDEQSINDMREEIRSIDRSFGYSNDQDISMGSRTSRAWMNIFGTAPGMYISMINNITTKAGIKHIGEYAGASVIYFVAAAVAAGMNEDEIKKRLNPLKPGFMKVDVDMGSGGKLRIGFSQFYTSLFVAAAKQADVFKRVVVDGETLTKGEYLAPITSFARARVAPWLSAAIGLATDEDFMGKHVSAGGTIFRSMTPTSLQDPLSVIIDNTFGTTTLASAEQHFNAAENETMKHKAVTFVANVMGMSAYTLDTRQKMSEVRDTIARDKYGTDFKSMTDMGAASEIALQVNQQFKDIPKWTDFERIAEIQSRERSRFTSMIPSEYKNYVQRTGAADLVRIGGIELRDGSFMFTEGMVRDGHYKAAIDEAINMPGGLRDQKEFTEANQINPAHKQKEALDILNKALSADNKATAARMGIMTK